MVGTLRWFRWSVALSMVTCAVTFIWFAGQNFTESSHSSWLKEFPSDPGRWWRGDVDRDLLIRTGLIVVLLVAIRMAIWLLMVAVEQARCRSIRRPAPRILAFVLTSGAALGAMAGDANALSGPCIESWGRFETTACPPLPKLIVPDSSRVDLVGTAVVSGLIGAGLALRLRSRDKELRRRSVEGATFEHDEADPAIEQVTEVIESELMYKKMIDIVRRVSAAEPENRIVHLVDERNGWIVVEFVDPPKRLPHSEFVHGRALRMKSSEAGATDEDLVHPELPALLHVGRSLSGDVWISLDEYKNFEIDCSHEEGNRVWRHLCQSLVIGPSFESRGVVSDRDLGSTFVRRCFLTGDDTSIGEVTKRVGQSIAVVHNGSAISNQPTIRRSSDGCLDAGLKMVGGEWRLLPADVAIRPVGSNSDEISSVKMLLGARIEPIVVEATVEPEPDVSWTFMACVLGPPRVVDSTFEPVRFERGKAEELVIWLAFHPEQRRRSLARSALWLSPVQDATFSNITAAARRSLNAVRTPPEGQAWVGITMSDELPLAEGLVTDVDILRAAVSDARLRPEESGLQHLRRALELVRGVPFAGSTYTWSDGIGVCGEAATLVVRASLMMAEMCQENGDIAGVYWATAKGLLALPGHEELVAIRLRAQAVQGDRIAMKAEWESFRRALASDWGDAEPSTRMMEEWRRLTSDRSAQESHQSGQHTH